MKSILLLGGAPAIGKTTIAKEIASKLNIPCLSTDEIRADMRLKKNRGDYPGLFLLDKDTVKDPALFLGTISLENLISRVNKESEAVWEGVLERINLIRDNERLIIEGAAILPSKAATQQENDNRIHAFILINNNLELIEKTIRNRGLGGEPDMFSEQLKQKQINWVRISNQEYKEEAYENKLEIIDVNNTHLTQEIIERMNWKNEI